MKKRGRPPIRWDLIERGSRRWCDPDTGQRMSVFELLGDQWDAARWDHARTALSVATAEWFARMKADPEQLPPLHPNFHDDDSEIWGEAERRALLDMRRLWDQRQRWRPYLRRGPVPAVSNAELLARYDELPARHQRWLNDAAKHLKKKHFPAESQERLRKQLATALKKRNLGE